MTEHKRRVMGIEDLTEEDIALIAKAEVPVEYAHLDAELGEEYIVSLSKDTTGVRPHNLYLDQGLLRSAQRIVIAADPPHTFNPHSKSGIDGDR
jgi:hypothetical protein